MSDRAKIFMPFDALKGFKEAIREKERIVVEKKELTESDYDRLNQALASVVKGTMVRIVHYSLGEYIETFGLTSEVNPTLRYIKVVKEKISFDDIQDIIIM